MISLLYIVGEVDVKPEKTRYIGKDWKGRGMAVATMKNFEDTLKVMKAKSKLERQECYIEDAVKKKEKQGKYKQQ
jgi:hypothetical protein